MNKHTPGPWIAQPDKDSFGGWAIGVEGKAIDEIAVCDERNARLIAAALELLEALQSLMHYFNSGNEYPVEKAIIKADSDAVQQARAAIAKATGETK